MKEMAPSTMKTRRKLLAGIGLLSLLSIFKFGLLGKSKNVISCAPPPDEKKTMKVLTQDGQLVEVDISKIATRASKVSNKELQEWVKKS
jgi:maltodextrin utilization protein YvdJ